VATIVKRSRNSKVVISEVLRIYTQIMSISESVRIQTSYVKLCPTYSSTNSTNRMIRKLKGV